MKRIVTSSLFIGLLALAPPAEEPMTRRPLSPPSNAPTSAACGCTLFTDYMSLHRFDGGWRIVAKVFAGHQ